MTRRVRILLYPGVQALDVTGPHEVFVGANRWSARAHPGQPAPYEVQVVAATAGPVRTESGLALVPDLVIGHGRAWGACHTIIVPGTEAIGTARADGPLLAWVTAAAQAAQRTVSICSGTFLLAEAGLLRTRATTHWALTDRLASDYPHLQVQADALFVEDGDVWTAAGVTAGIDLALALVDRDLGPDAAQAIARWLVMFTRRPGGQSQFAPELWRRPARTPPVRRAVQHVCADPAADLSVAALAAVAGLSERQFSRVFTRETSDSPGRFVERVRVDAARRRLEQSDDGVRTVARATGFGTAETMRRAFLRHLNVTPTAYRSRFAQPSRSTTGPAQEGATRP